MYINCRKSILLITALLTANYVGGCGGRNQAGTGAQDSASLAGLGDTIGSLARIMATEPVPVEGIGLVVGLEGAGSAECPPRIRDYLKQYILRQLPASNRMDVDGFIDSHDTAVVSVQG